MVCINSLGVQVKQLKRKKMVRRQYELRQFRKRDPTKLSWVETLYASRLLPAGGAGGGYEAGKPCPQPPCCSPAWAAQQRHDGALNGNRDEAGVFTKGIASAHLLTQVCILLTARFYWHGCTFCLQRALTNLSVHPAFMHHVQRVPSVPTSA